MTQGQKSTRAGGRYYPTDPAKLEGTGTIRELMIEEFGTTTDGGNMTLADGTVGSDMIRIPSDAKFKEGSG